MKKQRRDQIQIITQLLKIIRNHSLKTHICQRINVSYVQLNIYLELLKNLKLIRISTERQVFLSENGLKFIELLGDKFED